MSQENKTAPPSKVVIHKSVFDEIKDRVSNSTFFACLEINLAHLYLQVVNFRFEKT
jgi:hypothetical protein